MTGAAQLEIPYDEAALDDLGAWIDAFAVTHRLTDSVAFALQLCLEEAVSNAVRHGAPDAEGRGVVLSLDIGRGSITAQVEDHGPPFDPLQAVPPKRPTSLDDAMPGGLGIHLMRQFCDDIAYDRIGGTNRLTLVFPA